MKKIIALAVLLSSIIPVKSIEPMFLLPDKIYAVVGRELNIYFDNVFFGDVENVRFDVDCARGQHFERFWRITPEMEETGLPVIFRAYVGTNLIATKVTRLDVCRSKPLGIKLLAVGDSTVADGCMLAELDNLACVQLMGRQHANRLDSDGFLRRPCMEALAGQTAGYFATNDTVSVGEDLTLIHLGINDMRFVLDNDEEMVKQTEKVLGDFEKVIAKFPRVALCPPIPPAASQDGFGMERRSNQTRWRSKRNHDYLVMKMLERFKDRPNIRIVPMYAQIDTVYNFGFTERKANARNPMAMEVTSTGGVHPSPPGYWQMADSVYAFLCSQFESK